MPSRFAAPTLIFAAGMVLGVWSLAWPGTASGDAITIAFFSLLTTASVLLWRRDRRRAAGTKFPAIAWSAFVALALFYTVPVLWMRPPRMVVPSSSVHGFRALAGSLVLDLVLFSPVIAVAVAYVCYASHVRRIEPERRVWGVAYAFGVVACGGIAAFLGFGLSVTPLCSALTSGNLCGLGAVVVGIFSGDLGMIAVGVALVLLVRPTPRV